MHYLSVIRHICQRVIESLDKSQVIIKDYSEISVIIGLHASQLTLEGTTKIERIELQDRCPVSTKGNFQNLNEEGIS